MPRPSYFAANRCPPPCVATKVCVEDRRVPLLDVGSRQDLLMLQPVDRHAIGLQDAEGVGLVEHRQQVHHSVGNL